MNRRVLLFLITAVWVRGEPLHEQVLKGAPGRIDGFTYDQRSNKAWTWGEKLIEWEIPSGRGREVARFPGVRFLSAVRADVDRDGRADLVASVEEKGERDLVWYDSARYEKHRIAAGVDSLDMIEASLLRHRGVLIIQKRMQVRMYEFPARAGDLWARTDLYSVYTPSEQGGLALADVDNDGYVDILCGNYWIRSPEEFALPWHLFAINTWTEEDRSGLMRLVYAKHGEGPALLAAQRGLRRGRVAWFAQSSDPRQQWPAEILGEFNAPEGLALVHLESGGEPHVIVGERGGQKRLMLLDARATTLARGEAIIGIQEIGRGVLVVKERGVSVWRP